MLVSSQILCLYAKVSIKEIWQLQCISDILFGNSMTFNRIFVSLFSYDISSLFSCEKFLKTIFSHRYDGTIIYFSLSRWTKISERNTEKSAKLMIAFVFNLKFVKMPSFLSRKCWLPYCMNISNFLYFPISVQ